MTYDDEPTLGEEGGGAHTTDGLLELGCIFVVFREEPRRTVKEWHFSILGTLIQSLRSLFIRGF